MYYDEFLIFLFVIVLLTLVFFVKKSKWDTTYFLTHIHTDKTKKQKLKNKLRQLLK